MACNKNNIATFILWKHFDNYLRYLNDSTPSTTSLSATTTAAAAARDHGKEIVVY